MSGLFCIFVKILLSLYEGGKITSLRIPPMDVGRAVVREKKTCRTGSAAFASASAGVKIISCNERFRFIPLVAGSPLVGKPAALLGYV